MIFNSEPTPKGQSWTITSKLGHILRTAEGKYGERDKSYTILGVELATIGNPRIWYPGDCKHVVIQITMNCLNNMDRAVYQVSHEAIHCLCPTGELKANVLEEGLANLFSIEYCKENGHGDKWKSDVQKYTDASELVNQILDIDEEIIKKLRMIQPTISLIDKKLILEKNPDIPEDVADELTKSFY